MKTRLKNIKSRIRIDINDSGVCVWFDNRWIIDASTINEDGTFCIADNCKSYKDPEDNYNSHFVIRKRS